MNVFCPNCGTQNQGNPGARVTCAACQSSFEVPRDVGARPAPRPAVPPVVEAPPRPVNFGQPPPSGPLQHRAGPGTNTLAVISLVSGLVCCVPVLSPALSIGCGLAALRQIDAAPGTQKGRGMAIAGLILGGLTALVQLLGLIGLLTEHR